MKIQRLPRGMARVPSTVAVPHRNTGGVPTRPLMTGVRQLPLVQRQVFTQPLKRQRFT